MAARTGVPDFLLGASFVWRGFRAWSGSPRLMAWGLVPGAITVALIGAVLVWLGFTVDDAATWLVDRVASGAAGAFATFLAIVVAIALFAGGVLIAAYTFTAVTLFLGQPFFEKISRHVDAQLGDPMVAQSESWWRATLRGLAEAIRLLLLTGVVAVGLFLLSLVPVVGTATAFVLGAVFGGWLLSLELTAFALSRRGTVTLRERRRQLAGQRAVSTGFGATVFLLFLIPFGAVATMPAATVGATLLVRRLCGEAPWGPSPTESGHDLPSHGTPGPVSADGARLRSVPRQEESGEVG